MFYNFDKLDDKARVHANGLHGEIVSLTIFFRDAVDPKDLILLTSTYKSKNYSNPPSLNAWHMHRDLCSQVLRAFTSDFLGIKPVLTRKEHRTITKTLRIAIYDSFALAICTGQVHANLVLDWAAIKCGLSVSELSW